MNSDGSSPPTPESITRTFTPAGAPSDAPVIPGYEIQREIARGGQGVVYLAWQKSVDRPVAIKVLSGAAVRGAPTLGAFQHEAKLVAQLHHARIVTVHDSGFTSDGRVFIVMDYLEGDSLTVRVQGPRTAQRVAENLRLFLEICEAVGDAHRAGVIHCDLKPGNIRLDRDGRPNILDFGLARLIEPVGGHSAPAGFVGTIPWSSPEQAAGKAGLDGTTDVYSLGVILFQLLTGRLPFALTGNTAERLQQVIDGPTPDFSTGPDALNAELTAILRRCLQREPGRRYHDAVALAEDIRRYLAGRPVQAMGPRRVYLLGRRLAAVTNRHPVMTLSSVLVFATVVAYFANDIILAQVPGIDRLFRRTVQRFQSTASMAAALEHVRVIALTDATDLESFGPTIGLIPYDPSRPQTIRPYCGRLLQRLVAAEPRVIAFDIAFRACGPYDAEMLVGLEAASKANIPVVLAAPSWTLNDHGLPEICPDFLPYARWGCFMADLSAIAPWALESAVRRGDGDVLPSLSLSIVAAYIQPQAQCVVVLNELTRTGELRYWTPNPAVPQARPWLPEKDVIRLTGFQEQATDSADGDFRAGDLKAFLQLNLPGDDVLRASTLDFRDAMTAEPNRLRPLLRDCAVIVANQRSAVDVHRHPDGRTIHGSHAHAVGLSQMIADLPRTTPTPGLVPFIIAALAGLVGAACGAMLHDRPLTRWVGMILLTVGLILFSLFISSKAEIPCNPTFPVLLQISCAEMASLVFRARRILLR